MVTFMDFEVLVVFADLKAIVLIGILVLSTRNSLLPYFKIYSILLPFKWPFGVMCTLVFFVNDDLF